MLVLPKDVAPIPGFDGYFAAKDGRILSCWKHRAGGKQIKESVLHEIGDTEARGYRRVKLRPTGGTRADSYIVKVHALILETFAGPRPEGHEVRHLNGDKTDNRLENLQWATHLENMSDLVPHGAASGCFGRRPKLSFEKAQTIRSRNRRGESEASLAREYGVTVCTISDIVLGYIWKAEKHANAGSKP